MSLAGEFLVFYFRVRDNKTQQERQLQPLDLKEGIFMQNMKNVSNFLLLAHV